MTRLQLAAPAARTLRALIGMCTVLGLAVVASGCALNAPPAPTPDPFVGLADRSDQAFRQGLESYAQGQYRDALTSFEQARLLNPTVDPRIDQMIARSQEGLAPKPTPVPPAPTDLPATPAPTQVARSMEVPDTTLGSRYFGNVFLGMVPSRDIDAPAATQFFFQDQIGLHIDALKEHLKLPFTVRVFNLDSGRLVAEVQSEDVATAQPTAIVPPANLVNLARPDPAASATPAANDFHLVRFFDTFVWYHQGGDEPGHYVVQLFANGVLTNNLEYTVGNVPIPVPTATAEPEPTLEPTSVPIPTDVPLPAPAPAVSRGSANVASAPPAAAEAPTPLPSPTAVPTPQTAYATTIGGVPAGLDVDVSTGRFFVIDASGLIWSSDAPTGQQRPTLGTPINIGPRQPVDMAMDPSTGNLYLSTRACAPAAPGCILVVDSRGGTLVKSISLPAAPADLRVDPDLGLLYVALPELQALAEVDTRGGKLLRVISGLPQITSLALDPLRHTLYAAALTGEVTVVDVAVGKIAARMSVTGAGLASIATARGLAYAVNTATHELAVVEPVSQTVIRYVLNQEPAAVAAAEDTGAVYVLSSRADVLLRVDPSDGSEVGRVTIGSRSGHTAIQPNDLRGLRPRLVLNSSDDTLFATLPEAGSLAAMNDGSFPVLAREIPQPSIADQALATDIPEAIWPAAVGGDGLNAQRH